MELDIVDEPIPVKLSDDGVNEEDDTHEVLPVASDCNTYPFEAPDGIFN